MNSATILVVDDEPQIRRVMRATLTSHGYAIKEAKTGEEALESFRYMMDVIDEDAKARCLGWSNGKSGVHIVT